MTDNFYYKTLDKYLKELLSDLKMSMQIRVITNQLFIEKVQFLGIELRTKNEIFQDILNQHYKLIKSIPCEFDSSNDQITLKLSSKFIYSVDKETMLFYFVWIDSLGNIIKPGRPFQIIEKDDTFTLH